MEIGRLHSRLVHRLEAFPGLSEEGRRLIAEIPMLVHNFGPGEDIVREGQSPSQCCLVLRGFVMRHKTAHPAKRQIISFYVPGDLPDLQCLVLPRLDDTVSSLGASVVAMFPHSAIWEMLARSPELARLLWRETLVDAAIARERVTNLGQRDAIARVAHLLCEMNARLNAVGLAHDLQFCIPWTQADVADACGISTVHVNRVIQELRGSNAVEWRGKEIRILNLEQLSKIGEFCPNYLHLSHEGVDEKPSSRLN